MSSNIYQENGYENRKDYLKSVADEYGIDPGNSVLIR